MNRFSSDTATADDSLPFIANILLANLASLLGVVAVLAYSQPMLLLLLPPLGVLYYALQVIAPSSRLDDGKELGLCIQVP